MNIEFINHASVCLSDGENYLITDPWIEGTAFDNGWALISESIFKYESFSKITHIWFSHEHPDHFSPFVISKIPPELKKNITILYHQTIDKKIINFCKKSGFKETIELVPNERFYVSDSFYLICSPFTDGDSWLYSNINGLGMLNLNDCVVNNIDDALKINNQIDCVDVLLTQFSYAHKIGNQQDVQLRINKIEEKKSRIKAQNEVFKPKFIIPFASFVYFCHEENNYMNLDSFPIRSVNDFIENDLVVKSIVMYPGDSWNFEEHWESQKAISKHESDYKKKTSEKFISTVSIPQNELIEESLKYGNRLISKNPTAKKLLNKLGIRFYITDYSLALVFQGARGLMPSNISKDYCDIAISSSALNYIFKYEWGAGTCHVNARYTEPEKGDPYRFSLLMKMGNLNNEGKVFIWDEPSMIRKIISKINKMSR